MKVPTAEDIASLMRTNPEMAGKLKEMLAEHTVKRSPRAPWPPRFVIRSISEEDGTARVSNGFDERTLVYEGRINEGTHLVRSGEEMLVAHEPEEAWRIER